MKPVLLIRVLALSLVLTGGFVSARSSLPYHGGKKMLIIQTIAEALMNKQATIASVASTIGKLGERQTSEYLVTTTYPGLTGITIGVAPDKDANAPPKYVQILFAEDHPVGLAQVVSGCTHWKKIPGNPKSSPWLYSCLFSGSNDSIEVTLIATLTADVADITAHISKLLLQRAVWK